jgi:hypothetical protein
VGGPNQVFLLGPVLYLADTDGYLHIFHCISGEIVKKVAIFPEKPGKVI